MAEIFQKFATFQSRSYSPHAADVKQNLLTSKRNSLHELLSQLSSDLSLRLSLALSSGRSLTYRNQSIHLQNKSMDWFLYARTSIMKELSKIKICYLIDIKVLLHTHFYYNSYNVPRLNFFNLFTTNVALMQKPGSWFLLAK